MQYCTSITLEVSCQNPSLRGCNKNLLLSLKLFVTPNCPLTVIDVVKTTTLTICIHDIMLAYVSTSRNGGHERISYQVDFIVLVAIVVI